LRERRIDAKPPRNARGKQQSLGAREALGARLLPDITGHAGPADDDVDA
jgi:hypothetical protein